eukprot:8873536-Pyramimonas_sp.AAC.1
MGNVPPHAERSPGAVADGTVVPAAPLLLPPCPVIGGPPCQSKRLSVRRHAQRMLRVSLARCVVFAVGPDVNSAGAGAGYGAI